MSWSLSEECASQLGGPLSCRDRKPGPTCETQRPEFLIVINRTERDSVNLRTCAPTAPARCQPPSFRTRLDAPSQELTENRSASCLVHAEDHRD